MSLLKEIQALLSHAIPDGDYNAVLNYMGKQVLEPLRRKKGHSVLASPLVSTAVKPTMEPDLEISYGFKSKSEFKKDLQKEFQTNADAEGKAEIELKKELEVESESEAKANTDKSKRCVPSETLKQNVCKNRSRYIPQKVKLLVYARSKGQCEFVATNGHRCSNRHELEFDHIIPWSQKGNNDERNIQILCRTHNLYRTKETHGFWY
ncbi:MAG: HNH endonuclease [Bdellovibrio sp.]